MFLDPPVPHELIDCYFLLRLRIVLYVLLVYTRNRVYTFPKRFLMSDDVRPSPV